MFESSLFFLHSVRCVTFCSLAVVVLEAGGARFVTGFRLLYTCEGYFLSKPLWALLLPKPDFFEVLFLQSLVCNLCRRWLFLGKVATTIVRV